MVRHSAVVRTVLLAGLLGGIFSISTSHADTVYLKSGISISVTKAQEKDGQIEYWVGSTRYTISKDRVLKIEKGDVPVTPTRGAFTGVQDLTRRDSTPTAAQHDKVSLPHLSGPKQNEAYFPDRLAGTVWSDYDRGDGVWDADNCVQLRLRAGGDHSRRERLDCEHHAGSGERSRRSIHSEPRRVPQGI